ncbi:MAG: hypothetical protein UY92_C0011G0004 [Candidatus Magasanikbacteria bacterium GW2011_GWA2_56_11]|uniref:Uncharacterized protein n=1 Tax=Candidatus Magasanikbacteria bacterium GW2011_GWA2_56_11 TaxID=1619044 RepID=A0A0G2AL30_9BACT|nr:MAG: hypothetical protein UY92_C0011G0004 [Candidatus Magasanikbacteria bacterium GW2011_GWA2_56_11]
METKKPDAWEKTPLGEYQKRQSADTPAEKNKPIELDIQEPEDGLGERTNYPAEGVWR